MRLGKMRTVPPIEEREDTSQSTVNSVSIANEANRDDGQATANNMVSEVNQVQVWTYENWLISPYYLPVFNLKLSFLRKREPFWPFKIGSKEFWLSHCLIHWRSVFTKAMCYVMNNDLGYNCSFIDKSEVNEFYWTNTFDWVLTFQFRLRRFQF